MSEPTFNSFGEFWPYYLGEHRNARCRQLHFVGTLIALSALITAVLQQNVQWVLAALLSGYSCAWVGHFFFEKNRPATFKFPVYSFLADWKMFGLMAQGKLRSELHRLGIVS